MWKEIRKEKCGLAFVVPPSLPETLARILLRRRQTWFCLVWVRKALLLEGKGVMNGTWMGCLV